MVIDVPAPISQYYANITAVHVTAKLIRDNTVYTEYLLLEDFIANVNVVGWISVVYSAMLTKEAMVQCFLQPRFYISQSSSQPKSYFAKTKIYSYQIMNT